MLKKLFLVSITIFILFIIITFEVSSDTITNNILAKNTTPIELPIARLHIEKINVNNDIYRFDSSNNTVEKNVQLLDGSIFPDKNDSIVFLAAHSGNSNISYFNNLEELNIGDEINLYYKNKIYTYVVKDKFLEDKDGDIEINKDSYKQLVLTTCSTTNNSKQLIINSNLNKIEDI